MLPLILSPLLHSRVLALSSRSRPFCRHASSFLQREVFLTQRRVASRKLLEPPPPASVYIQRRPHGTHGKRTPPPFQNDHDHDHHTHEKEGDSHDHAGHAHSHLVMSLSESSKRGTRITLIGLGANVGLTVTKGVAGLVMNSASLVADAAHSLSDLISDFVTLYTFRMSRKPPDSNHPYGYGKYETVGSLAVSSLLITGAIGIGWHSYELLLGVLTPEMPAAATDAITAAPTAEATVAAALNPNAAWFALASVVIKEWLYRATMKVGIAEKSNVLVANAWHHRSDAFSSIVALGAIGGSYLGFPILDPLGGILVAGMIMKSGVEIMLGSLKELVDVGVEGDVIKQVEAAIAKVQNTETNIIDFHSIRGRKAGPFFLVDLILQVNPDLTVSKAHRVEEVVRRAVKQECQQVKEVMIHLDAEKEPPHP